MEQQRPGSLTQKQYVQPWFSRRVSVMLRIPYFFVLDWKHNDAHIRNLAETKAGEE